MTIRRRRAIVAASREKSARGSGGAEDSWALAEPGTDRGLVLFIEPPKVRAIPNGVSAFCANNTPQGIVPVYWDVT